MRCLYRERKHFCGDYLEVDIFPVFIQANHRKKKAKPTTETQANLNKHNAEMRLIRILNTNFTHKDIRFDLTYNAETEPRTPEEAQKHLQNFLRRVKRFREKQGLPELKYVAVTEKGKKNGRLHHHLVMSGGVSINDLAEIWGKGYTTAKPLQFDEFGIVGIAVYLIKKPILGKRWNSSRNLQEPIVSERDGRISAKKARELHGITDDRKAFEDLYEGYSFAECKAFYNEFNSSYYLCVRMYRDQKVKKRYKKKGEENGT